MSPILHSVTVKGSGHTWGIDTYITRETAQDWRDDGLDVVEVMNRIPAWWVHAGLSVRLWCFCQDVFHFRNPWR
jgi:hypothetical protein